MGCSACKKRRSQNYEPSPFPGKAVDFSQHIPTKKTVKCNDRRIRAISQPLTKNTPHLGFLVDIKVGPNSIRVTGRNATEVFLHVRQLYRNNGINLPSEAIWFNMNRQWLDREIPTNRWCSVKDLETLDGGPMEGSSEAAEKIGVFEEEEQVYGPAMYGAKLWSHAEVYLAQASYKEEEFQAILDSFQWTLEDELIGCPECSEHFTENRTKLPTQKDAKIWLFNLKNKIREGLGKNLMSYSEVKKIHHWS